MALEAIAKRRRTAVRAGNPGIARWAACLCSRSCDGHAIVELARSREVELVVIGPEAPLVAGVGDSLRAAGFAVFGPNAAAAQLEGSKGFTKDLCAANGIPTARYVRVETEAEARAALHRFSIPVVIKADGLAAGKGVTVATTRAEAEAALAAAGDGPMVIEEFLDGEEASLFALVDGETRWRWLRRRTTSASARAIPARTPAGWEPIARRRC